MYKYYIKWGRAGNEYSLCYAPSDTTPGEGWEKITRKKAEQYATAEAVRRKEEPNSAYFADAYIYPYDITPEEMELFDNRWHGWHTEGRIVKR